MNAYDYIKKNFRENLKSKLMEWRRSEVLVKLDKPSDIGRARTLGYKAKNGFIVLRERILRGGRKRSVANKRRRGKKKTIRKVLKMNYQWVAEQRAARKYTNLEVLNSYLVGKDGMNYFYEIILVNPDTPEIQNDSSINWICKPENRGRAFRGLTSAAKKSRGLRNRAKELKVRPSLRAWDRRGK